MHPVATDHHCTSADHVRLHYRDFAGGRAGQPAIVCLPGLTRNVRDFEALAGRLAAKFRVLTLSYRGRGESGTADDPATYVPATYVRDLGLVLQDAGCDRFVAIGTSLGGIVGALYRQQQGAAPMPRLAGIVLNDIGPLIGTPGLTRIRASLGRGDNWPSWLVAAREIARLQKEIYPDWTLESWLQHAKRLCRVAADGRIVWDYDPEIATPFNQPDDASGPADLWPAFESLKPLPVLLIRGELSDILAAATQQEMTRRLPELAATTVPRVGHAPTLEEPPARRAIDRFLRQFL